MPPALLHLDLLWTWSASCGFPAPADSDCQSHGNSRIVPFVVSRLAVMGAHIKVTRASPFICLQEIERDSCSLVLLSILAIVAPAHQYSVQVLVKLLVEHLSTMLSASQGVKLLLYHCHCKDRKRPCHSWPI